MLYRISLIGMLNVMAPVREGVASLDHWAGIRRPDICAVMLSVTIYLLLCWPTLTFNLEASPADLD
jgi:hypothetical protein